MIITLSNNYIYICFEEGNDYTLRHKIIPVVDIKSCSLVFRRIFRKIYYINNNKILSKILFVIKN